VNIVANNKKDRNRANQNLRDMNTYPLFTTKSIEPLFNVFLDKIEYDKYRFKRNRKFNFKSVLCLLIATVVSGTYTIANTTNTYSGKSIFGFNFAEFSKQAFFKRLKFISPKIFKFILFNNFVKKSKNNVNLNNICVSTKTLRQFKKIVKIDLTTLDKTPKGKLNIKTSSKNRQHYELLGGVVLTMTDLITEKLHEIIYSKKASRNDLTFKNDILKAVKKGYLLCFDRGYNSHNFFNELTEKGVSFIMPKYSSSKYKIIKTLYSDNFISDKLVFLGSQGHEVLKPVRLISVKVGKYTYDYITNVSSIDILNPKEVFMLYKRRWNIEKTFNYVKRNLNLSYMWSSDYTIVETQVYITFIVYTVMVDLIRKTAISLEIDQDRISFNMIKKSFFQFSQQNKYNIIDFLCLKAKKLGIIKSIRNFQIKKQEEIYIAFCESCF